MFYGRGGIYWLFNKFWIGKYKFLPITQKVFAQAKDNEVDPHLSVIGVNLNGEQKAYPANLLFYHHQLSDTVGGRPILATYCGMCRSGRVYDIDYQEILPASFLATSAQNIHLRAAHPGAHLSRLRLFPVATNYW